MVFLVLKRNSPSVSNDHFNWKDFFLSAASKIALVLAKSRVWRQLYLLLVLTSAKHTSLDTPTEHMCSVGVSSEVCLAEVSTNKR